MVVEANPDIDDISWVFFWKKDLMRGAERL